MRHCAFRPAGSATRPACFGGKCSDKRVTNGDNPKTAMTTAGGFMDLKGTEGNDHLVGAASDDTLSGLGGNDTLEGLGGHDELYGGAGNDLLLGGDSYDYLTGGPGDDTIDGGDDADWVFYSQATGAVNVSLASGHVSGADGNDLLRNVEQVYGSAFNDVLVGDASSNVLYGGAGDDTLDGGAGEDDAPYWDAHGAVNVNLATGRVTGAEGNDQLSNIEDVEGSSYDDVITGDGHDNRLEGRDGNDTLSGGGGTDTFIFGSGAGAGVDRVTDLVSGDMLQFGAGVLSKTLLAGGDPAKLMQGQVMLAQPDNGITRMYVGVDGTPGADVVVELVGSFSATQFTTQNTSYGAVLFDTALDQAKNLAGTAGDDVLQGGNRDDTLSGLAGSDTLYGGDGNDLLLGGDGSDYLNGGLGNDTLDGGAGDDSVFYDQASGPVNVNLATG
jgi:Ca2+-binding RTX toxin-like protein